MSYPERSLQNPFLPPHPPQEAIEAALRGEGDSRVLVPLVGVIEDGDGERAHDSIRGRDAPGSEEAAELDPNPKGFALKGFLDVTVLTSPLVVARFEAVDGSAHKERLEVGAGRRCVRVRACASFCLSCEGVCAGAQGGGWRWRLRQGNHARRAL